MAECSVADYDIDIAALGGCTHFVTCPADDDESHSMTVGFGQGAVSLLYSVKHTTDAVAALWRQVNPPPISQPLTGSELGLGGAVPLSVATPTKLTALDRCEVIE